MRETVSDNLEGLLPGSQDANLAIQGIVLTGESLILRVHDDTYRLPATYRGLNPQQLLDYGYRQKEVKNAILNDGRSPVQLKALRQNRRAYVEAERARRNKMQEELIWCDYLLPAE